MLIVVRPWSPASSAVRLFGFQTHADREEGERLAVAEQLGVRGRDSRYRDAVDVVLAVREHDDGRPRRVSGQILGRALHRRHVVRVVADRPGELPGTALAIVARDVAKTLGQVGDGVAVVVKVQVGAATVVSGLRRELDEGDRSVPGNEIRHRLIDAVGDLLECLGERGTGPLVVQNRPGEIE